MSNGNFTVQGQQNNLPLGNVNLGPLIAQCSPISEIISIPLASGSFSYTVPTAATVAGAILVNPPANGAPTVQWGTAAGTSQHYVNPSSFSIWTFDPHNVPTSVVVVITGTTATVPSTLQFF